MLPSKAMKDNATKPRAHKRSVSFPAEQAEWIERMAKQERQSFSGMVQRMVDCYRGLHPEGDFLSHSTHDNVYCVELLRTP